MSRGSFVIIWMIVLFAKNYGTELVMPSHGVTYTLSGGRLGDNLMAYMHAKWISYHYGIPLIYKPFPLSDLFVFDDIEIKWTQNIQAAFNFQVEFKQYQNIDMFIKKVFFLDQVLYIIPYFPESNWELTANAHRDPYFPYFRVSWKDPEFHAFLKTLIVPKKPIAPMVLPTDKITVAVHIRRGGSYEGEDTALGFPLKFPPDEFYLDQLRKLYYIFDEQPFYVYLFTDDEDAGTIKKKYQQTLADLDIKFDCREEGNRWDANVLEDFFALTQFDCAIHGESNFSVCAGFLADYKVEILPKTFHKIDKKVYIDEVTMKIKGLMKER